MRLRRITVALVGLLLLGIGLAYDNHAPVAAALPLPTLPPVTSHTPAPATSTPIPTPAPDLTPHYLAYDGRNRSYLLHLPPDYTPDHLWPLVMVMHSSRSDALSVMQTSGMNVEADAHGFIVVYPNGTSVLPDRYLTWNSGNCCSYAMQNKVDDVGFIHTLIRALADRYKVDPDRVYATGISNGGMMAYRLGCELSGEIAAIAPVAAALDTPCQPLHPVSVIAFHGTADEHVPYYGGNGRLASDGRVDNSQAYSVGFWVNHDRCYTPPSTAQQGHIVVDDYAAGRDSTEVTLYTVEGGGHTWPGGPDLQADPATHEINATDLMWQFFAAHPQRVTLRHARPNAAASQLDFGFMRLPSRTHIQRRGD